jgi:hypothetical protein
MVVMMVMVMMMVPRRKSRRRSSHDEEQRNCKNFLHGRILTPFFAPWSTQIVQHQDS